MQATSTQSVPLTSQDYAIIGKLAVKENPDFAQSLLERFRDEKAKALDSDTQNIKLYLKHFCRFQGIDYWTLVEGAKKKEIVDARRLFIAVMLRVYKPQIFTHDIDVERGLADKLCHQVLIDEGNMSKIIDEIKVWVRFNQEDYCDKVQEMSRQLIETLAGYGSNLFSESQQAA